MPLLWWIRQEVGKREIGRDPDSQWACGYIYIYIYLFIYLYRRKQWNATGKITCKITGCSNSDPSWKPLVGYSTMFLTSTCGYRSLPFRVRKPKHWKLLQYDLANPCIVHWRMQWFSAPTSLNHGLLKNVVILEIPWSGQYDYFGDIHFTFLHDAYPRVLLLEIDTYCVDQNTLERVWNLDVDMRGCGLGESLDLVFDMETVTTTWILMKKGLGELWDGWVEHLVNHRSHCESPWLAEKEATFLLGLARRGRWPRVSEVIQGWTPPRRVSWKSRADPSALCFFLVSRMGPIRTSVNEYCPAEGQRVLYGERQIKGPQWKTRTSTFDEWAEVACRRCSWRVWSDSVVHLVGWWICTGGSSAVNGVTNQTAWTFWATETLLGSARQYSPKGLPWVMGTGWRRPGQHSRRRKQEQAQVMFGLQNCNVWELINS